MITESRYMTHTCMLKYCTNQQSRQKCLYVLNNSHNSMPSHIFFSIKKQYPQQAWM